MGNRLIKFIFVILYAFYTIVAVNTRLVEQIIPYGNFYVYFYIVALIILLLVFHYKPLVIRNKDISFKTIGLFTIYIFIFSIVTWLEGPEGDLGDEVLAFAKFIMVAAITIYFVKQFDLFSELLFASLLGGSALLAYEYALAGFPLDIFSRLTTFFSNVYVLRYRLAFNFNNPNTVGNIAACMMVVYFLFLSWVRCYEEKSLGRTLRVIVATALAVVDMIVLLSSGSRNSMVTLLMFFFAMFYFKATDFKRISERQKGILKGIIVVLGVIIVYITVFSSAFEMFETSGRLRSFEVNVPLVLREGRFFEGLGLMNPGLFGRGSAGYIVDNYYLYVFMETGIIGLVMISWLLIRLTKKVHELRITNESFYVMLSSAFIAWLVSGLGETCVIYPYFPSSLVFFVIFLVFVSGDDLLLKDQNEAR